MPRATATVDRVHSDNFDYYYLKYLKESNDKQFEQETSTRIIEQSIWFPPTAYSVLPIAVPYAYRDRGCRSIKRSDGTDMWGCPNSAGYVRDDNSLIKGLVKQLDIDSPPSSFGEIAYKGRRLGRGFVAAHIWPRTTHLAQTNSFWPNLVWLPKGLALLSDHETSFVQPFLQDVSMRIYGQISTCSQGTVAKSWWILLSRFHSASKSISDRVNEVALDELNYFRVSSRFLNSRLNKIRSVSQALECIARGKPVPHEYGKIVTSKYTRELQQQSDPLCVVAPDKANKLHKSLRSYASSIEVALQDYKGT